MQISSLLLEWYDKNARQMPWRIGPAARKAGTLPDPYAVWLSEIMLQQTTVAAVDGYFRRFLNRWPTVADLAAANDADVMGEWAGLGYYARARNLLKCARKVVADCNGTFPTSREDLLELPGIGPYTASAIAAIAFDHAETVVDGNVERVISRLNCIETPLPAAKVKLTELAEKQTPTQRPGDYAQAIMDLGATICTPRNPACGICPLQDICEARKSGLQAKLPRKAPKKPKPVRRGFAYIAITPKGAILLERRPENGLLGGMLGWPGSEWSDDPEPAPPLAAEWTEVGEVRHTFTHFHLILTVLRANCSAHPENGAFTDRKNFKPSDLPTVMRKAWDLAAQDFPN